MQNAKTKNLINAKSVALTAIMIATIVGGKLALVVPQVEIVSLLLIAYSLSFGLRKTMLACFSFILIDIFIWGPNPMWVVLYIIYWPLLVLLTCAVKVIFGNRKKKKGLLRYHKKERRRINSTTITACIFTGVLMTIFFGVLSSFIDIAFVMPISHPQFFAFFAGRYIAGVWFFGTHILSNIIILSVLLPPLVLVLQKLKHKYT